MKKKFLALLISASIVMVIGGCGNNSTESTPAPAEETEEAENSAAEESEEPEDAGEGEAYKISFICPNIGLSYWTDVKEGLDSAAADFGVTLDFVGPSKIDTQQQIQMMEAAIANKADGIIVASLDANAFIPVIDRAVEEGIPVICLDADSPDSKRSSFIGTENSQRPIRLLFSRNGELAEGVPAGVRLGGQCLREPGAVSRRLCVSQTWHPPADDTHHLHLEVQADRQKVRPAGKAECAFTPPQQRQPADCQRSGCCDGGGTAGACPALYHARYLHTRFRQKQESRQRDTTARTGNLTKRQRHGDASVPLPAICTLNNSPREPQNTPAGAHTPGRSPAQQSLPRYVRSFGTPKP